MSLTSMSPAMLEAVLEKEDPLYFVDKRYSCRNKYNYSPEKGPGTEGCTGCNKCGCYEDDYPDDDLDDDLDDYLDDDLDDYQDDYPDDDLDDDLDDDE